MKACQQCGKQFEAAVGGRLCPECMLKVGLGTEFDTEASAKPTAAAPGTPQDLADVSQHFPQLEILALLGTGGMGAVYKARQKQLDRVVALKILPPEAGRVPAFAERFLREARALARLNHPNIVTIHDFGEAAGLFYLIMEYVDGANLRQMEQAGRLPPPQALTIVPKICDALQYAHDEGIVHRDIKPENILVDKKGRVKIADFGLAKLLGKAAADFTLTGSHQAMGTPRYMAPEQMEKPLSVDHRADIYSLGVVLYEMLTGELPIGRFQPPSVKVHVDVRLDEVVLRSMEHDVERRYQHVSDVKTAIERVSVPVPVPQAPVSSSAPVSDSQSLLPKLMVTAVAMVIGGLTMAAGIALALFAILSESPQSGQFWGWMGGAVGCLFGGGGALIGALNSYRQIAGAGNLMMEAGSNWLDRVIGGYAVLGAMCLVAGAVWSSLGSAGRYALLLFGVIVVGQSALFWALRRPYRRLGSTGSQTKEDIS
jgi:predicted Ser/Thr protein kinase